MVPTLALLLLFDGAYNFSPPGTSFMVLEDGVTFIVMEDGITNIITE